MPKLYTELAAWWPLISPPGEYADEATFFWETMTAAGLPSAPTLLELGCGGGNNALHLRNHFDQMTLTDLSPDMLAISRALNPLCEHIVGDMRTLRLGRTFDVVFVHDAIDYMITEHDLHLALQTAAVHCAPGGLALLVPDYVAETFAQSADHGGSDNDDRAARYLEWTYRPQQSGTTYTTEYVYLLREGQQPTQVVHDRHVGGLFPRATWLHLLRSVGFDPQIVRDEYGRDVFVAHRPTDANEAARISASG